MVNANTPANKFGTLGGVFTPCTLTILGVIMFLRFGQVVGNAGVWHGILIVMMAKVITTLTALSLSAIATNTKVKGGGAYYLISRSLGVEFGGAIGIVFFLSQAISVAMYVIGFTEALLATFPALPDQPRLVGTAVNVVVLTCVLAGAGWTIKVQFIILAVLAAAIVAFAGGAIERASMENFEANWAPDYGEGHGFLTMFALFFPAATGIMAGANLSGDLARPDRSIPRGTLMAILVTAIVYIGFALLLGMACPREELLANGMVVSTVSWSAPLIAAGVFAATMSSALGSLMGAPRILQALARDRVFPWLTPFGRGSGSNNEPRLAIALTFVLAEGGIVFGDLDAVAPIITMFFMITYGALNWATFTEVVSHNPSYRPTFRFCHWSTSLAGALGCTVAMFLIDPVWAVTAVVAMVGIHQFLSRQNIEANWGDVQSGAVLERVRRNLLVLEQEQYHPKNWRPAILALGAGKEDRLHMAVLSRRLCGPHGLLMFGQVIIGEPETFLERQRKHQGVLRRFIAEHQLEAFPVVAVAQTLTSGVTSLVQCCGIGALRPNLVILGFSEDPARRADFVGVIRAVHRLGRSIGLLRTTEDDSDPWAVPEGTIDVWWRGLDNGPLMLLLAHLLRKNSGWRTRGIRIIRMIKSDAGTLDTTEHLEEVVREARIRAECEVVVGEDFRTTLMAQSSHAALVIVGFQVPDEDGDEFVANMEAITTNLPRVLMVNSAGDMNLH